MALSAIKMIGVTLGLLASFLAGIYVGRTLEHPPQDIAISTSSLVRVIRVVDGDTIEIEGGAKVRYIGIDTPESVDPRRPVECFGKEASRKNKELVEGRRVRLEKDISDHDKFGRLLRYVYIDTTFVNLELVRQGYATSATFPPDVAHQQEFVDAQAEAREANRGLWQICNKEP